MLQFKTTVAQRRRVSKIVCSLTQKFTEEGQMPEQIFRVLPSTKQMIYSLVECYGSSVIRCHEVSRKRKLKTAAKRIWISKWSDPSWTSM